MCFYFRHCQYIDALCFSGYPNEWKCMFAKTKYYIWISTKSIMLVLCDCPSLVLINTSSIFWHWDTWLPVLNDAHHGSSYTHIDDLRNIHKEVFLNLKTAFPNAPAAIHEKCNINFAIYKDKMRIKWEPWEKVNNGLTISDSFEGAWRNCTWISLRHEFRNSGC